MKEIILKSANPEEYPDLAVECKVIPNDKRIFKKYSRRKEILCL